MIALAILSLLGMGLVITGVFLPWLFAGDFVARNGLALLGGPGALGIGVAAGLWAAVLLWQARQRERLFAWYVFILAGFVIIMLTYSSMMDLRVLARALSTDEVVWALGVGPLTSALGGLVIAATGFAGTTALRWRRRRQALRSELEESRTQEDGSSGA